MTYISICDDNELHAKKIRELLWEYGTKLGRLFEIELYTDARELLVHLNDNRERVDILLLDISMPYIDGFEAAMQIRAEREELTIIFLSSHEKYVYQSFAFQPFRFVRKSHMEEELFPAIRAACERCDALADHSIVVRVGDSDMVISFSELYYFEKQKKFLYLHLKNGKEMSVRLRLQ